MSHTHDEVGPFGGCRQCWESSDVKTARQRLQRLGLVKPILLEDIEALARHAADWEAPEQTGPSGSGLPGLSSTPPSKAS